MKAKCHQIVISKLNRLDSASKRNLISYRSGDLKSERKVLFSAETHLPGFWMHSCFPPAFTSCSLCTNLCSNFPFLYGYRSYWIRVQLDHLLLNYLFKLFVKKQNVSQNSVTLRKRLGCQYDLGGDIIPPIIAISHCKLLSHTRSKRLISRFF